VHISDGVLPLEVMVAGFAATGAAVTIAVRRFDERRIPEIAVLTSLFFVASLISVPVPVPGAAPVHLLFNGLAGIILGWLSFPSIFVALFFQAILLGHGGLTAIGANTIVMASGAVASHLLFRSAMRLSASQALAPFFAFAATLGGTAVSALLFILVMSSGGEALGKVARFAFLLHLPVALLEGLVAAPAVAFLSKVKPELLGRGPSGCPGHESIAAKRA
jgi:cobalt/nickel transport system permease protein